MRRTAPVVLAVVGLALVAAGCGHDNKASNAYVDKVNRAQNTFAQTFDRLSSRITSTSSAREDRKTLAGFRAAIDKAVSDLRAIVVPDKVKPLHRRLIDEISSYGRQVDRAKTAFASGDPRAVAKAQTALISAVTHVSADINATIDEINKRLRE
jgi:hypothetical protein